LNDGQSPLQLQSRIFIFMAFVLSFSCFFLERGALPFFQCLHELAQIVLENSLAGKTCFNELAEGFELWRGGRGERIETTISLPPVHNQPNMPERCEVSRNGWLRKLQHRLEVANTNFSCSQKI